MGFPTPMPLYGSSTLNDAKHDNDDRDNQEDVNEPANSVRGNQAKHPQYD